MFYFFEKAWLDGCREARRLVHVRAELLASRAESYQLAAISITENKELAEVNNSPETPALSSHHI